MCFGTEPFLYCWCSLNKKGSIIFDEDDNDSNDDHDNVLKEKKRFLHVLFELNQKNYEIRQMNYIPQEKMLWFGQFVKLMFSSPKKNRVLHNQHYISSLYTFN